MGPLALADLIGLDTVRNIGEVLRVGVRRAPVRGAGDPRRGMIAEGRLGRKTGGGFHEHATG